MLARCWRVALALVLAAVGGCATPAGEEPTRGSILKPASFQLGPNPGRDFLYLQGDGKFGL